MSERLFKYSGVNLPQYTDKSPPYPANFGTHYTMPPVSTLDAFQSHGFNTVHLLIQWERVQPALSSANQALDWAYMQRVDQFIKECAKRKMTCVLGLRSFAEYYTPSEMKYLGNQIPIQYFANLWVELANRYSRSNNVVFDLMNEPRGGAAIWTEVWREAANWAIWGIRAAGFMGDILVCGNGYSGAAAWLGTWYGTSNSVEMLKLKDAAGIEGKLLHNIHMYMDADGSGVYASGDVAHVDTGVNSLMSVTDWARNNGRKLYLGEFGAPDTVNGREAVRRTLEFLKRNRDVWVGWSWWCAAPWANYKLNLGLNAQSPQVGWLSPWT